MMDTRSARTKSNHESAFKAPASMPPDKVSHTANPNSDRAKKYTFATRERYYKGTRYRYF